MRVTVPEPAPAPPAAPTNLSASPTGTGLRLSWQDNSSDEAGFRVESSASPLSTSWQIVGNWSADVTQVVGDAVERSFEPRMEDATRSALLGRWRQAVERSLGWEA